MNLKDTYNLIAKDWSNDHAGDTWWVPNVEKFLSYLKPRNSVLDVGCGAGDKTKFLVAKGFDTTAIDFSEEMVEISRSNTPNAKYFVRDILEPINLEQKFNGILAQAVLLHVPKKEILRVLQNLKDQLVDGGYMYIAVKSLKEDGVGEKNIKESDYGYEYERFFSFYSPTELESYFAKLNMEVIFNNTILDDYDGGWIQIIAKKKN